MIDKRLGLCGFLGGIGLGIVALSSPSAFEAARDFTEGLLGIPERLSGGAETAEIKAEFAAPALSEPLQKAQLDELFQGLVDLVHDRYPSAVQILGKYALMGEKDAQSAIGAIYFFGKGLPLDREEGIRWLRLAVAQGDQADSETLAAALDGTWQWESQGSETATAYAHVGRPELGLPTPKNSSVDSGSSFPSAYSQGGVNEGSAPIEARSSLDYEPASRRYSGVGASNPQVDIGSPIILNPAGPGTYSDADGDVYTQAGPHGVVNTRTGEFSPTN